MVEGTFKDGTFLGEHSNLACHLYTSSHSDSISFSFTVTVHDPICTANGDLKEALYGSFFPIPSPDLFSSPQPSIGSLPGALVTLPGADSIVLCPGRDRVSVRVTNTGDRPIQVGSRESFRRQCSKILRSL